MNLQNNSQRYIYLVDDDEDDCQLFVDAIHKVDPTIILTQIEDGKQLMDILQTSLVPFPEIIFLDINMPCINGFECLKEIRKQQGKMQAIKVVMPSTSNDPVDIEKAFRLGVNFYAVKPCRFDDLKCFLKEVLQIDWRIENKNFRLI